jgi:hypothetical protein
LLGIIAVACVCALAFLLDDRYNRGSNVERDPNVKRAASCFSVGMSMHNYTKEQEEELFEYELSQKMS